MHKIYAFFLLTWGTPKLKALNQRPGGRYNPGGNTDSIKMNYTLE